MKQSDNLRLKIKDEDGNDWIKIIARNAIKSISFSDGKICVRYYELPLAREQERLVRCDSIDDMA